MVFKNKKKVFIQADLQFFWFISYQVFHQVSSQISLGGLFSFLVQKSASKVLKTGYFAHVLGQWGGYRPPGCATEIPGILSETINAKAGKKSIFFDKKSKFQIACPPLPVN